MSPNSGKLTADQLDAAVELMGRSGRGGTVRVQGRSMLPTLEEGQILAVDFAPGELSRGDMLVFRQVDYLVVHRLLGPARRRDGRRPFRTRGDGLPTFDPAVDPRRVVARVVAVRRADGWRSVRGGAARLYARCLAWHDLFWAATGVGARLAEGGLARIGLRPPLRAWVAGVDRLLLGWTHRLLFERIHPTIPQPAEAGLSDVAER